jgi:hypothetical protein
MWQLDTSNVLKDYSWWWWWWLLFLDPPEKGMNPRQLMILWSTKDCEQIKVNDYMWRRKGTVEQLPDGLRFNGMTCAWYYDGKTMHDPFVLEENDFRVKRRGGGPDHDGQLLPKSKNDYSLSGKRDEYRLNIVNDEVDFRFRMTPLGETNTHHRFKSNKYSHKFSYNIYKIYGMKLDGRMKVKTRENPTGRKHHTPVHSPVPLGETETIQSTAYFQKLLVNSPAVPWMWGMFHMDDGSFMDYMIPHVGLNNFRRSPAPKSPFDRGPIYLTKHMEFYDAERDEFHQLHKTRVKKSYYEGIGYGNKKELLPIFHVTSHDPKVGEVSLTLKSYSRAYWRFEQKWMRFIPTVLYYNEYPVKMIDFDFRGRNGHRIKRDRWDTVHGNCEYSWGFLL